MTVANFLLDLFFPHFCVGCGRFDTLLCEQCFRGINFYPLPIQLQLEKKYLASLTAMAEYEGVIKKLITSLKYQGVKDIGDTLGRMLYYTTPFSKTDLITAVPLHHKRKKERGFNQAQEIALTLSSLAQTPYAPLLKRIQHTSPQASISDKAQRLKRLKNTFALNQLIPQTKTILLIDDVATTGTTLNECARVLLQSGAEQIYGLVVAHGH